MPNALKFRISASTEIYDRGHFLVCTIVLKEAIAKDGGSTGKWEIEKVVNKTEVQSLASFDVEQPLIRVFGIYNAYVLAEIDAATDF